MGDITEAKDEGRRILYAFDFDHTILEGNSDTDIMKLLPGPLPPSVQSVYDGTKANWTIYMGAVFRHMAEQGISVQQLKDFVRMMPSAPGMDTLLKEIQRKKSADSKLVILSDSNDIFIPEYISYIGVSADDVITNKGTVTPEGALKLDPYENQQCCKICPSNLCKGKAISKYIEEQEKLGGPFSQLIYVGDGRNDACPASRLREQDIVFVRKGFALEKIVKEGLQIRGQDIKFKAQIVFWEHGDTIKQHLF